MGKQAPEPSADRTVAREGLIGVFAHSLNSLVV
jgi:hypothetical protein